MANIWRAIAQENSIALAFSEKFDGRAVDESNFPEVQNNAATLQTDEVPDLSEVVYLKTTDERQLHAVFSRDTFHNLEHGSSFNITKR